MVVVVNEGVTTRKPKGEGEGKKTRKEVEGECRGDRRRRCEDQEVLVREKRKVEKGSGGGKENGTWNGGER